MPRTRDRSSGATEEEDEIILSPTVDLPSVAGALNYSTADGMRARDAVGTFRLRHSITTATVTAEIAANADAGGVSGGTNLSAQLPDFSTGVFAQDYEIYLNGKLCTPTTDYVVGTSAVNGQLKFTYALTAGGGFPDRITVVKKG